MRVDIWNWEIIISRASSSYECFILRAVRLSNKLLGQGYVKERLRSSLRKFYGWYGDLIKQYEVPLSRIKHDILDDDHLQWHPPLHYISLTPIFDPITDLDLITEFYPPWGPGGLSRECAPPYPQRDRKRRLNGAVCRNHRIKRLVPCRC